MGYPAPFTGSLLKVEDQWVDYNGHFNMAYYNVLFDRAGDEAVAAVGLGPNYVKERNNSFFTLECHNPYVRELHAGDSVRIETQFLDCDAKRVHYVQQMFHATEGWKKYSFRVISSSMPSTSYHSAISRIISSLRLRTAGYE